MVERGIVSSIEGSKAVIEADSGITTLPLNIPDRFTSIEDKNKLQPGQEVIFAYFNDGTGSVLERM